MPSYSNSQIAEALRSTKGMTYLASRALGCSPHTIIDRIKKHPHLQELVKQLRGERLDTAELKLDQAVMNGESWAVKYILSNQGKDRGYSERIEHSGPDGGPIQVQTLADLLADSDGDKDEA